MKTGCVILAAGRSKRFDGNKLTAPLRGVPILERTIRNLPLECFDRMIAVVSREDTEQLCIRLGLNTVLYPGGPVSDSIREGLKRMRDMDACLFVNGDQPLIRPQSVRTIVETGQEHPDAIIRLEWKGTPGSPVLFPERTFGDLAELTGDTGGRQVIRNGKYPVITVDAEAAEELFDIDTAKDLERMRGDADTSDWNSGVVQNK